METIPFKSHLMTARMAASAPLADGPRFVLVFPLRFFRVAVLLSVWREILATKGSASGMSLGQVLTYALIAEVFADPLTCRTDIESAFWDGSITNRFLRPIGLFAQFATEMIGRWLPGFCLFSIPLMVAAPILGVDPRPASAVAGLLFILSLALGISVGLALEYVISALSIAMEWHPWAMNNIRTAVGALLSGSFIPLPLLPWGIGHFFAWLPFATMAAAPLQVYTGTGNAYALIAFQVGWSLALWPLATLLFRRMREKMLAYGG